MGINGKTGNRTGKAPIGDNLQCGGIYYYHPVLECSIGQNIFTVRAKGNLSLKGEVKGNTANFFTRIKFSESEGFFNRVSQ